MFQHALRVVVFCCLFFAGVAPTWAGRYPAAGNQTFTFPDGTTVLGDGTTIETNNAAVAMVTGGALRLAQAGTGNSLASFKVPDLDPGKYIGAFDATFGVKMKRVPAATPADGWSLNFGNIPAGNGGGEGGFAMLNGLTIAFDTYSNSGADPRSIEVFANGVSVGNFLASSLPGGNFAFDDDVFRAVVIHWDENGLDLTYAGQAIFTNLPTPGFVPSVGARFGFSARTGGATQDTLIDDLVFQTTTPPPIETGGVVITEFMAENQETLEDEELDTPDWIELYNGQNATANLNGWKLRNVAGGGGWTLPNMSLPPYSYRIVYASGKNRTNPSGQLHTDFTLQKEGGYLALVRPDTTLASEFTYGAQEEDISYGEKDATRTKGYLMPASPGGPALMGTYLAAGGQAETAVILQNGQPATGGLFTAGFQFTFQAPVAPGAVIRYTTNNTEPNPSSPAWTLGANLSVSASTTYRARVFTPGKLPGKLVSRTWLQMDASLTNYNGSGSVFSSHLPVLVMDSFGFPVDSYSDPGQPRPYRTSYAVLLDRDPLAAAPNTNRAILTGKVDFQGRCGTHVRGESSSGFAQKSYAWELWDENGKDKDSSLLGLPEESDWVLHGPYTDKTLMRNYVTYASMRENAGDGSAMRTRFVEVFFNQEAGQPISYSDYRGVYVLVEKIKINKDRVDLEKLNNLTTDPAMITGGYILKHDKPGIGNSSFNTGGGGGFPGVNIQGADPENWNSAQQSYLQSYLGQFEGALYGANFTSPTVGYAAYIDVDSFIDNQWWIEIAKQIDGYRISAYYAKDRGGKMRALPVWDYNLSLSNAYYMQGDQFAGWYYTLLGNNDYYWYPRLHQDPAYKLRHWDRYWMHRRGVWATAAIQMRMNSYASEVLNGSATPVSNNMAPQPPLQENAVMRHYRKYQVLGTYLWPNAGGPSNEPATLTPRPWEVNTTYQAEVDFMKTWIGQRLNWIDDQNFIGSVIYRPPNFNQPGGSVSGGFQLTITPYSGTPPGGFSYAAGTIYYTTNGTDPRAANGAPAGTVYSGPITLNASATVTARLYNGGNWSPMTSYNFIVNASPASAENLVVSEFCYRPLDSVTGSPEANAGFINGNNFEYIELQNVSGANVDLTGCQVAGGVTFHFAAAVPATLTLPPGGRVLLVENRDAFLLRYGNALAPLIAGEFDGNLSNSGETFTVLAKNGGVIASIAYGIAEPWPVAANGPGYALTLRNLGANPAYGSSAWRSSAQIGGSPGQANSAPFTGSPDGDTDDDGYSDFLEYATASDWTENESVNAPVGDLAQYVVNSVPGTYMRFRYRENLAAGGFLLRPQWSTDLSTWPPSAVTYVQTINNGDGTATVEYRSTQPVTSGQKMMMRLMVTPQ